MKILLPILGFGKAGGYRVLSELANSWHRAGHDVCFLVPDNSEKPYFPTEADILCVNGKGELSQIQNHRGTTGGRYNLKAIYRGIKRIGRNFDIILANHCLTSWPVALAGCGNAKKFYYVQAYEPEYYFDRRTISGHILGAFAALSYHLPLKRISNAPIYLRYRNLRTIDFIPPGLDLSIFKPLPVRKVLEAAGQVTIGCIGRREPEKGTVYVLRAFEKLYQENNGFRLLVAYGNLPDDWKHEGCRIVVPRNDRELSDYYRSLDILVAPGTVQHGAAHYPVMEALACGIPVVTTGYLGATESTAWLTRNRDVDGICDAIRSIIRDPQAAREKAINGNQIIQEYAWSNVARAFLNHFS